MGRYYNGDINGEFWLGIQPSDAADRFGVIGYEPQNYLSYYFSESDIDEVEKEIKVIENTLGKWKSIFEDFFNKHNGYNDATIEEDGYDLYEFNHNLKEYADLLLGIKIRDCIKKEGKCEFNAEY